MTTSELHDSLEAEHFVTRCKRELVLYPRSPLDRELHQQPRYIVSRDFISGASDEPQKAEPWAA